MRKFLLVALAVSLLFTSCTTVRWQIGQSTSQFFTLNKGHLGRFHLVKQSEEWTIYRAGEEEPVYFYFHYDKLYQVDRGSRPADLVIEKRY